MRQTGFTLVELIVTMIIIGILAASALPRFMGAADFDPRGFHDSVLSTLRNAQKTAVAQRRRVCVTFGADRKTISLRVARTFGVMDCNDSIPLTPPGAPTPEKIAKTQAAFTSLPQHLDFLPDGSASRGQTFTVKGHSRSVTIEQATGYVHE